MNSGGNVLSLRGYGCSGELFFVFAVKVSRRFSALVDGKVRSIGHACG